MSDEVVMAPREEEVEVPKPLERYQRFHLAILGTGLLFSLVTVLVISTQLFLILRQTGRQADLLRLQAYTTFINMYGNIDKVFIEHPELRPFFFGGVKLSAAEPLFPLAASVAEMHLDIFEQFYNSTLVEQLPYLAPGSDDRRYWDNYMRDTYGNSPILCSRLAEQSTWYSASLRQYASAPCGKHGVRVPLD